MKNEGSTDYDLLQSALRPPIVGQKNLPFKTKLNKGHVNRVLFINPPTDRTQFIGEDNYFPLGLISLATVLRKNGDAADVIDANNEFFNKELNDEILDKYIHEYLITYIKEFKPDLIGIGGTFSGAFKYTKVIGAIVKRFYPDIPTIVGGNHASTFKGMIIQRFRFLDYVMIGEGEHTFPELVECLVRNQGKGIEKIDGLCYRKGGYWAHPYNVSLEKTHTPVEDIIVQEKLHYIEDLDELPHPDFNIVGIEKYYMDTTKWYNPRSIPIGQPYPIISSRSCPMRCTFCNMWHVHGPSLRCRSPKDVVDEIENLYNQLGARYFQFMDDNFTYDKERVKEICYEIIKRKLRIQWDTPNGIAINRLDPVVIQAMVDSGMIRICVAIESGSNKIRNEMKKGLPEKEIISITAELAKYEHVFVQAYFIIGMPGETLETLEETKQTIFDLPLDKFGMSYATPFPGTPLFNECKDNNLLKYDVADYVEIDGHQLRSDKPHFKPYKITEKNLMDFMEWAEGYQKAMKERCTKVGPSEMAATSC